MKGIGGMTAAFGRRWGGTVMQNAASCRPVVGTRNTWVGITSKFKRWHRARNIIISSIPM